MSRAYDFVFKRPDESLVEMRGYGNTRKTAESAARSKLRRLDKVSTTHDYVRCSCAFAKDAPP